MTTSIVRQWSSENSGPLSEASIRENYPKQKYRVSRYHYPTGTKFAGVMRRGTCHVLSGTGRFTVDGELTLRAGELAEFPEGRYVLEVVGDDELVMVMCWELPFEFNQVQ